MKQERQISPDALRGLIMVLMALDHASYFIAKVHPAEYWGLALPRYSDALAFLTRFLTHPCAPGFFFLMGTGMSLLAASRRRLGWSESRIHRFFLLRGLMLVGLELFFVNAAWGMGLWGSRIEFQSMGPGGGGDVRVAFQVLSALGFSMILSSLLIRSRPLVSIAVGASAILTSLLILPAPEDVHILFHPILRLLSIPGQTGIMLVMYPIIPWMGVCSLGMGFGKILLKEPRKAFRYAFISGLTALFLFVLVRGIGGFGNIHPPESGFTGFLNTTKYPPSLTFLLLMLGINLLLLALFDKVGPQMRKWGKPILTLGRTALFFYVLHLFLFAFLGFAFPYGTRLHWIYPVWLGVLLILYPLCRRYGNFKRQTPPDSIWRFF
jgi:uncharacterized membrane protein